MATNFRIVSIEPVDGTPKVEWVPKTNARCPSAAGILVY